MIEIHHNRYRELEPPPVFPTRAPGSLGDRLREIRGQLGFTQAEVERLTRRLSKRQRCPDFTLTKCRLSRIENGWSNPGPAKILGLAKVYHLSVKQMVRLWSAQASAAQESKERTNAVQ
jgi:transcriptional regulator with XRE-family HTH domain